MAKGHGSDGMKKGESIKVTARDVLRVKVEKVYQDQLVINNHLAALVGPAPLPDEVRLFHEAQHMIMDIIRLQEELLA